MAVFVLKKERVSEFFCMFRRGGLASAGLFRHKNELAERYAGIPVPYSGARTVVVEVFVLAVCEEKDGADKSLRQTPGPLGGSIDMVFQLFSVLLFHGSMITQHSH